MIAQATKTAIAVLVAGKFKTLGSNFSHETAGLLASFCYYKAKSNSKSSVAENLSLQEQVIIQS